MKRILDRLTPRRPAGLVALVGAVVLVASAARAGNVDSFFYGQEAAVAGGAVTAHASGAAAAWYNPAGLSTSANEQTLDVSVSAYSIQVRNIPNYYTVHLLDGTSRSVDGRSNEFQSVPTSVVYVRPLTDRLSGALGVFTTKQTKASSRVRLDIPFDEARGFGQLTSIDSLINDTEFQLGPIFGYRASDDVRVGAAFLFSYRKQDEFFQWLDDTRNGATGERFSLVNQDRFEATSFGFQPSVGIQVELTDRIRLGGLFRAPQLALKSTIRDDSFNADFAGTTVDGSGDSSQFGDALFDFGPLVQEKRDSTGLDPVSPARFTLGLAYVTDTTWMGLEGDYLPGISNKDYDLDTADTFNVRVGFSTLLYERFQIGAGFFTDRSLSKNIGREQVFQDAEDVDYYGVTVGVTNWTSWKLVAEGRDTDLVLKTTIGARYAYGTGQVRTFEIDTVNFDDRTDVEDVTFHELSLYLGSSIAY